MSPVRLFDAAAMRDLDRRTIDEVGIPGVVLMERAGLAVAEELTRAFPSARTAVLLCGTGGNGGDGFVAARHLAARGVLARPFLLGARDRVRDDAGTYLEAAAAVGVEVVEDADASRARAALADADVVVDALFGTGFEGAPRAPAAGLIDAANACAAPVVAVDIPSGIDASTGTIAGTAVEAALTVTFHGRKVGLEVAPGRFRSGRVVVADIGIPAALERATPVTLAPPDAYRAIPPKLPGGTKYSAGAVLIVGGSPGMTGAALMAGSAALRAGAGMVWVAVPRDSAARLEGRRPELIVEEREAGLARAERADAVAVGPGLGRDDEAVSLARRLASEHAGPIVVDADGLFALAGRLDLLARRRVAAVLTPHEGEMGRLLEREAGWVRANRLESVREAARRSGAAVLLKGADTLVAAPGGDSVVVCASDVAGLATAGSGDVLTGVIAAALAKRLEPHLAAAAAAVAHARAGRLAGERLGPSGIIAGDVIDLLPAALRP